MATDDDHTENTNGDYTSVFMEDNDQIFAKSILAKLHTSSPLSAKCCIFRVPEVLLRLNEKVYEPDIVAIGPYHCKKRSLQPMEDVKKWYLQDLLSRTNMSMLSLIKGIKEFETSARECYQEPIDVDDKNNEFMEIMIVDGCFLIELFRKEADSYLRSTDDPIFNMVCMHQYLHHDLLLLENQLPWFILQTLFDLTTTPHDQRKFSLIELVVKFFAVCFFTNLSKGIYQFNGKNLHILEKNLHILHLLRECLVSSFPDNNETENSTRQPDNDQPEIITIYHYQVERGDHFRIPCVTMLLEAGVKFKKGSGSIMNIQFTNGSFDIPPLTFHQITGPMIRNMIAFEQCYHGCDTTITSYAVLMANLINTGKDVEYLVDNGIIVDVLSAEDTFQLFNRIHNDIFVTNFCYDELFKAVNAYHNRKSKKWDEWIAILKHEYFKTPWTVISLIGAIILLVLTFVQTCYSIK